ncbi:MAG: hypothetical protein AAGA60_01485 [Cyanobacteria bacterium P01_E01_bin.42]
MLLILVSGTLTDSYLLEFHPFNIERSAIDYQFRIFPFNLEEGNREKTSCFVTHSP